MRLISGRTLPLAALLAAGLVVGAATAQGGYKVESTTAPVDGDTKDSLQPFVAASGAVMLSDGDGKTLFQFWPAKAIPVEKLPVTHGNGQALNGVPQGALLGVMRLRTNGLDAKEQPVQGGIYAVRYLTQPNDGNHLGTSDFPDHAVLFRMNVDPGSEVADRQELIDAAVGATGHPRVFAMQPPPAGQAAPSLGRSSMGHLVLYVSLNAKAKNGDEAAFTVGIVPLQLRAE